MRLGLPFFAAALATLIVCAASSAATPELQIAPVTRLPFPERGYVVSVPEAIQLDAGSIEVLENGLRVSGVRVDPLASSGLRFGVARHFRPDAGGHHRRGRDRTLVGAGENRDIAVRLDPHRQFRTDQTQSLGAYAAGQ